MAETLPRECPKCTGRFTGDRCANAGNLHANGRRYGRCPMSSDKGAERFARGFQNGRWRPCRACGDVLVLRYDICGPCALAAHPPRTTCAVCGHEESSHHTGNIRPCFVLIHQAGQGYRCVCTDFHPIVRHTLSERAANEGEK